MRRTVLVGVELEGQFAVGLLDLCLVGILRYAQDAVVRPPTTLLGLEDFLDDLLLRLRVGPAAGTGTGTGARGAARRRGCAGRSGIRRR